MDTRKKTAASEIPRTGRIGRFAKILEKELDEGRYLEIMNGSGEYGSFKPSEKSAWWREAVVRMETAAGTEDSIRIMEQCGAKCCYNRCFCKQVANTQEAFPSLTYCHCSREFNRQFFSAALGKEVEVKIQQSIAAGADSCRFVIRIPD